MSSKKKNALTSLINIHVLMKQTVPVMIEKKTEKQNQ